MPYIVIFCLLLISFITLHYKKGIKLLLLLIPYIFILAGGLSRQKFSLILEPSDLVLVITLVALILFCLYKKRKYLIVLNFVDLFLLSYIFLLIILPLSFHIQNNINQKLFEYFIPIRLYVTYKLFYLLICEYLYHNEGFLKKKEILYIFFIPGIISGIVGLINIMPYNIPYVSMQIKTLFPVPQESWYRLWGTNGGTNAAGNLFSVLFLISIYYYLKIDTSKKHLLLFSIFYFVCVLLSGSFSSLGGLIISIGIYTLFYVNIQWKKFLIFLITSMFLGLIIFNISEIGNRIVKRFQEQFYYYGTLNLVPNNLKDRAYWAERQLKLLFKDNHILWGMGPGGMAHSKYRYVLDTGSESFYMELIHNYGILSILWFMILFIIIIRKTNQAINENDFPNIFFAVIIFYLVAGIANLTLHYGALTELFGFMLSLLAHKKSLC